MTDPDVTARLEAVRQAYLADLPQRRARLVQGWERLQRDPQNGDSYTEFHREVHSLSGSAATFGCDGLSEIARAFEFELADHAEQGTLAQALNGESLQQRYIQLLNTLDTFTAN